MLEKRIPQPTWEDCREETHLRNATRLWNNGREWRRCKRCDKIAEDAVQFGPRITNVYCMKCTCNECGESLEGWEEVTCESCMLKDTPK